MFFILYNIALGFTTAARAMKRRGKELVPDQITELDRLHDDQGTLADLLRDVRFHPPRDCQRHRPHDLSS